MGTQTSRAKRLSLSPKANSDCHIPCIETFLVPFNSLFGDSFNEQDVRHQSFCPPGDGSRRSGFGCRWRCCFRGRFVRQAWPFTMEMIRLGTVAAFLVIAAILGV